MLTEAESTQNACTLTISGVSVLMERKKLVCHLTRGTTFIVVGKMPDSAADISASCYVLKEIWYKESAQTKELMDKWAIIKDIKHENVARYFHAEISSQLQGKDARSLVLMEWLPMGSVADLFKHTRPEWSVLRRMTKDMVSGLEYIHSQGVFHGQLKPDNILIGLDSDDHLQAKIGGLDNVVSSVYPMTELGISPAEYVDMLIFQPPEILNRFQINAKLSNKELMRTEDMQKADIWSLGCVLTYLVTYDGLTFTEPTGLGKELSVPKIRKRRTNKSKDKEQPETHGASDSDIREMAAELDRLIRAGGKLQLPSLPIPSLITFVRNCLSEDPSKRPSATNLSTDPWLLSNADIKFAESSEERPHVIKLKSSRLLPRLTAYGPEFVTCSASCAVRMLAHFDAPKFDITCVQKILKESPKSVAPGHSIGRKYCELLAELLPGFGVSDQFRDAAISFLNNEEWLARLTDTLDPIGSPFPDLKDWMNTFEDDYEYVVKEKANWEDIEDELRNQRPVLVLMYTGMAPLNLPASPLLKFAKNIPSHHPMLHMEVLHGYTGTADENRRIFLTGTDGIVRERGYGDFIRRWDWELSQWPFDAVLRVAQVYKRSLLYRRQKFPGNNVDAIASGSSVQKQSWELTIDNRTAVMHEEAKFQSSRGAVYIVKGNFCTSINGRITSTFILKTIAAKSIEEAKYKIKNNWQVLTRIKHENVVQYIHVELLERRLPRVMVLMEWCQWSSMTELFGKSRPEWSVVQNLMKDMLVGLEYIHSIGIYHGDIKPDNIFIGIGSADVLQAKIGDLDDFIQLRGETDDNTSISNDTIRTLMYQSPERRHCSDDTRQVRKTIRRNADIWSMGCTFLHLASFETLRLVKPNGDLLEVKKYRKNDNKDNQAVVNEQVSNFILSGGRPWVPDTEADSYWPPSLADLVKDCLTDDPLQRPNATHLLSHKWFHENSKVEYIPAIFGIQVQPLVIKLKLNNMVPRQGIDSVNINETEDRQWSNGANCAVRFLAHFGAPRLRIDSIEDAERIINQCPKALTPGCPLEKKYVEFLREHIEMMKIEDDLVLNVIYEMLHQPELQGAFTQPLPAVSAPFPDMVSWMNKFENEYEYLVKTHASWEDVELELDVGRPVLVFILAGYIDMAREAKNILLNLPDEVPTFSAVIVHGYYRSTAADRILVVTSSDGVMHEWLFSSFWKCWNWDLSDHLKSEIAEVYDKLFKVAEVCKRSMVHRKKLRIAKDVKTMEQAL